MTRVDLAGFLLPVLSLFLAQIHLDYASLSTLLCSWFSGRSFLGEIIHIISSYQWKKCDCGNHMKHGTDIYQKALSGCGPGSVVGIATDYGPDGLGIESRWERYFPHLCRPALGAHPASCTMGTRSFPGVKSGRGVTLTTHPLLVPWSWKSSAIPLLPLWAVRHVPSLSVCTRVHFTLYLTISSWNTIFMKFLWYVRHSDKNQNKLGPLISVPFQLSYPR